MLIKFLSFRKKLDFFSWLLTVGTGTKEVDWWMFDRSVSKRVSLFTWLFVLLVNVVLLLLLLNELLLLVLFLLKLEISLLFALLLLLYIFGLSIYSFGVTETFPAKESIASCPLFLSWLARGHLASEMMFWWLSLYSVEKFAACECCWWLRRSWLLRRAVIILWLPRDVFENKSSWLPVLMVLKVGADRASVVAGRRGLRGSIMKGTWVGKERGICLEDRLEEGAS